MPEPFPWCPGMGAWTRSDEYGIVVSVDPGRGTIRLVFDRREDVRVATHRIDSVKPAIECWRTRALLWAEIQHRDERARVHAADDRKAAADEILAAEDAAIARVTARFPDIPWLPKPRVRPTTDDDYIAELADALVEGWAIEAFIRERTEGPLRLSPAQIREAFDRAVARRE